MMMSTKEAADFLGLGKGTLEVWRCKGRGPKFVKIARRVVYRRSDLEEYVAKRVVRTTDCPAV